METTAREIRRRQLMEVALALFAEKGYHDASIADIIERASVARGTFYNYFQSKRQIFDKLVEELFDSINASVFSIRLGSVAEMEGQVRGNIHALCATLRQNLPMAQLLLEQAVGLDAEANEQLKAFYARVLARLQKALEDGQMLGIVREGNAEILATCLLGMIKESLFQQILGNSEPPLDDLVDAIYGVVSQGILTAR